MSVMEAMLKKAQERKNKNIVKKFEPIKHRAWDYVCSEKQYRDKNKNTQKEIKKKEETELAKIGNKQGTNGEQMGNLSENKQGTNGEPIREQTGNKWGTYQRTNREQMGNIIENEIENKKKENKIQISENFEHDKTFSLGIARDLKNFPIIKGHQSEILRYITLCIKEHLYKVDIIEISLETLAKKINASKEITKVSLKRLQKKNLIIRLEGEKGRHGFCRFKIPDYLLKKCISMFQNNAQILNDSGNEIGNEIGNESASCSSSKYIKTTTTEKLHEIAIPVEWENLDFSELQKQNIFFGKSQIVSLWPFLKNHSAFDFQESIDAFVFDINGKHIYARRGYLNLFIGIIRKGELYRSSHFVSSEQKKIQEIIELSKKREEERKLYQEILEKDELLQWITEYGEEKIKNQLPESSMIVDFIHRGDYSLRWIRRHIYSKSISKS